MKKNVASQIIGAQLVSKTDGSAVTTGTTTIYVTGDGGTQAAGSVGSGACTHEGNGYWTYTPAQAETNYDQIGFTFVNTSACNATIQVYTTFPQTGDSFARIGAPAGASVSADIAAIEAQTDDIGTAGAGLSAIPWNASWDAEVQSEVADALTAFGVSTLTQANIRTAVGLVSANLDTQLDALPTAVEITDAVWDEVLTGATHNVAASAGRRLRQLSSVVTHDGTAQSGSTSNTIILDTGASSTDGAYDPSLVAIVAGTGMGQCRTILQYAGTTRTAVVDRDWKVTPDNTSEFVIIASDGRGSTNEGLAQAGTSSTITLNALASADNGAYIGQICYLVSGVGADQAAMVTAYNGTTKVATITTGYASNQWVTNPDVTTGYVMIPASPVLLAALNHAGATIPTVTDVTNGVLIATGGLSAAALATDAVNEIADGILDRNMATGTDSGSPTVRTPRQALRGLRNKASIAAGTLTVCKEDDSTTSWTAAVATSPSDPVSSIDPA